MIEPRYDYAEEFQENGLAVVQRGNVSGLIDGSGRERVKPVYNFIGPFSEGRAVVSDAKGYTFIDEKGKEVTSARYDYLNSLHEGRALFSKQNTTGGSRCTVIWMPRVKRCCQPSIWTPGISRTGLH